MLTNPVTPFVLLIILFLAACGGGGNQPTYKQPCAADCPPSDLPNRSSTPPEIHDSLQSLLAVADSTMHSAATRGSANNGNLRPGFDVMTWTDYHDSVGWMIHLKDNRDIIRSRITDRTIAVDASAEVTAWSIGQADYSRPIAGKAAWGGVMTGVHVSTTPAHGEGVEGTALLEISDFDAPALGVTFSNIVYTESRETLPSRSWSMLSIDDAGAFGDAGAGIQGRFYGLGHEEVGGDFMATMISGSFGVSK